MPDVRESFSGEKTEAPQEPKALRLARYLREFVGLRSTTVRDVDKYDTVLWFGEMPQEPECRSPAWDDGFEPGDPWLEVRKQDFPNPPQPPPIILPWVDQQALKQATAEAPVLRESILLPDPNAAVSEGEEPPLVALHLAEYPEISSAYEHYRPGWESWSAEHRRREAIQTVYAELFRMHTQVLKQGEILELVLGLGLLDWGSRDKEAAVPVRRHIVTARVDLNFDPATGMIRLESAAEGAQLRIEDDMLEAERRPQRSYYTGVAEQLIEIDEDVWDRSRMHTALRSWAEALHPDSQWSSDLRPGSAVEGRPMVSFAPALILRKRTQTGMIRVYDALIRRLGQDNGDVPAGWGSLVGEVDDDDSRAPAPPSQTTAPPHLDPGTIYFPLPANREQQRIAEAIGLRRGVLVQGPPGTGKSHTIANLVCHLLASGKRVLITAETGRALRVLKDKLPSEIQPLCVSLLGQSGDAFAELNAAVQGITMRQASYYPGQYDKRIEEIDRELDAAKQAAARLDAEVRTLREGETLEHQLAGDEYRGTASAIATRVSIERDRFGWLQLPKNAAEDPPIGQRDLSNWLLTCRSHEDAEIAASKLRLPTSGSLPSPGDFEAAVESERAAAAAVERYAELRSHPAYGPILGLAADRRDKLRTELRKLDEDRRRFERLGHEWLRDALIAALAGRQAHWHALLEYSKTLIERIDGLFDAPRPSSVSLPTTKNPKIIRADAAAAIEHLRGGGKWSVLGLLTPKALKDRTYLRSEVTVDDQPTDSPERLQTLCNHLDLVLALEDLERTWSDHGGLPEGSHLPIRLAAIKEHVGTLEDALAWAEVCLRVERELAAAAPPVPAPRWAEGQAQEWQRIAEATEVAERHHLVTERVTAPLRGLKALRHLHDAHPVVDTLIGAIERRDLAAYSLAYEQACRVEQIRRDLRERERVEAVLNAAVPGLVSAVAVSVSDAAWDERFGRWEEAWHWAFADAWLHKRGDLDYQQQLWQQRRDCDGTVGQLLAEAAALRAWAHFFGRLSSKESGALKAWQLAVRAMGKNTGRSSRLSRLRRQARLHMDQCREAIPVWIMPRYLVAEMVDPAPGRYDIVIVDEASQLGIESLFLFYIAKKMVVVGDDQQISPYGVGIPQAAIDSLQDHYLDGVPYQNALSAQSSLYDNAKIRFGQNIVLREHFRCMPEIIQFSNDLCYASNGTPLDPLRAYPANRLKPVITRPVADGYRTGTPQNALNEPEADALVAQLIACIGDPRYAGRTMGVISLQGEAQARLIESKLLKSLEPEVIEERRLMCGDAYAFQGDERHVMFLSMVAAPNERIGALANDSARQRFNVAASRAQDQLWLFHSVTLDLLSPACMRHRLLKYMIDPARDITPEADQQFGSPFERNVYRMITDKGFHVRTQVCIGDPTNHRYRIDLVVEGMHGRLAVECDGDQWHGPDRYEEDMARQRDLERAGWRFVRIRGGDFYRDRFKAMEPLWNELDRLGIRPGGIDEKAAEPPPPAESASTEPEEVEEVTRPEPIAEPDERAPPHQTTAPRPTDEVDLFSRRNAVGPKKCSPFLIEYTAYEGRAGEDPRTVGIGSVAEGLCRIIEVEGPMIAKRAYDIYLRGCGIKRMGHELRSTMNKALTNTIRAGKVISEDELGKGGLLYTVVRTKAQNPVSLRRRGPRDFDDIPPSELLALALITSRRHDLESGSDEHLRAVLEQFDLKRLTTQVGTTLLAILEKSYPYVEALLSKVYEQDSHPPHT
jgi:very-short-patch-repair endonuclease